jgi:hypothetical protein
MGIPGLRYRVGDSVSDFAVQFIHELRSANSAFTQRKHEADEKIAALENRVLLLNKALTDATASGEIKVTIMHSVPDMVREAQAAAGEAVARSVRLERALEERTQSMQAAMSEADGARSTLHAVARERTEAERIVALVWEAIGIEGPTRPDDDLPGIVSETIATLTDAAVEAEQSVGSLRFAVAAWLDNPLGTE